MQSKNASKKGGTKWKTKGDKYKSSSSRKQWQREGGKERGRGREAEAQANCKRCTILAPQVLIKCCSQVSVTHADIALDVAEGVWEGQGRPGGRQRGGVAAADTHILRQHLRIQCENELQPNVARWLRFFSNDWQCHAAGRQQHPTATATHSHTHTHRYTSSRSQPARQSTILGRQTGATATWVEI